MASLNNQDPKVQAVALLKDQCINPNNLKYFLALIQKNQFIEITIPGTKEPVKLKPQEAWLAVETWLRDTDSNLSFPEKGSVFFKAGKLMDSLESQQEIIRTAAAARIALQQTRGGSDNKPIVDSPISSSLQKALHDRKGFYQTYNDHLLNPLSSKVADSPLLAYITDDFVRHQVASQIVANWPNFISSGERNETTIIKEIDEMAQLITHTNTPQRNNLLHLIHSDAGETNAINLFNTLQKEVEGYYQSKNPNLSKEQALAAGYQEAKKYSEYALLGTTFNTVSQAIGGSSLVGSITAQDKIILDRTLRQQIHAAAKSQHLSGQDIIMATIDSLIKDDGTQGSSTRRAQLKQILDPMASQIETSEIALRSQYLGNNFYSSGSRRLLATDFVAAAVGIDPFVPWIKEKDLKDIEEGLNSKYGRGDLSSMLQDELAKGSAADTHKITELTAYLDKKGGYKLYLDARQDGSYSTAAELFSKTIANYQSIREPFDKFYDRAWKGIDKIDDIIHYPQRWIAEKLDDIKSRIVVPIGKYRVPVFGLGGFIADRWVDIQKRIALGIYKFSRKDARFRSSFWRGVANYSKVFYWSDANFARTNFHFVEKGWGNLLNWGAKKAGLKSFAVAKRYVGQKLWSGFSKVAPGLAKKFAGTAVQKIITSLGFATISGGTSLIIQIGLAVIGAGLKKLVQFFRDSTYRNKVLNRLALVIPPVFSLQIFTAIGGAIAALVAGVAGFIGTAFAAIAALFVQALMIAGIFLLSFMLIFQIFKATVNLDSGVGKFIVNVVCDESGNGNASVNAAACIAKVLSDCSLNPLTAGNSNTPTWQCVLASLLADDVTAELKRSATSYSVLQCVGLVAAVDIATGGSGGFPNAKDMDSTHPGSYEFHSGVGSCRPGDFFVDKNGTWGHTGVFIELAGPYIKCIDANGGGPGVVRDANTCVWPSSNIAGCLHKI